MYRAKENGTNRYHLYNKDLQARAIERLTLENSLGPGPQPSILPPLPAGGRPQHRPDGRHRGVVALAAPRAGPASPKKFIPQAEEAGLIVRIGGWVLEDACARHKAWERRGRSSGWASG